MKTKLTLMMLLLACLCCLQASAMQASQQRLETDYFWFDNPDGTIENYPEYIDPMIKGWAMSISSSKYAPGLKYEPTGLYKDVINFMFGRQTRTTVFVLDTHGMDDAGKTATANLVSGLMQSVPPLEDLFKMAGMSLPTYLKGKADNQAAPAEEKEDK